MKSSKHVIISMKDVVFELPCLWCAQCPLETERVRCLYNMSDPGTCMSCEAGKRLVLDTGICEQCPANQYREENNVTRLKQTECTMCPRYSLGQTGSNSLQNCECNTGFIRVYTDEQTFVCGCEFGRYIVNTQCEECGECIHGFYHSGCSGDNPGLCVQCNKQCSSDKQLAGCGGMHQGTCKKRQIWFAHQCALRIKITSKACCRHQLAMDCTTLQAFSGQVHMFLTFDVLMFVMAQLRSTL
jgi:hypothetical protein